MQYATEVRSVMSEVSNIASEEEDGDVRWSRGDRGGVSHSDNKERLRQQEERIRGLLHEQRGSDDKTFAMRLR